MPSSRRPLRTNEDWKRWGAVDPLWSAAAWKNARRGESEAWKDEDFYRLGASDWSDFRLRWQRFGLDTTSCVEIGCGAGRITASLVSDFNEVHGLDVSEGMLDYARAHVPGAQFYLTDGVTIPLVDEAVTAAFSCHVLQHLESPAESVPIFAEIHRVLRPDATLMIHLPLYSWPLEDRPISRAVFKGWLFTRQWLAHQKASLSRRRGALVMRGSWYEVSWLLNALTELGFVDVEFLTFAVASNGGLHPFVLARKPPTAAGPAASGAETQGTSARTEPNQHFSEASTIT